jgi:uncharacterized membrane protein
MARDTMAVSIDINAPPEKVWELLAWDRVHEWEEEYRKNLKSMEYTSEVRSLADKYKIGTTAHVTLKQGDSDLEITESIPHEKLTFHSKGKRLNAITSYRLEPVVDGANFTYIIDYEIPLGLLGRVLARTMKGSGDRDVKRSLENLKTMLEQ